MLNVLQMENVAYQQNKNWRRKKIGPSVTNTFRWGRLSASPGGANKLSKPSLLGLQLEVKAWRAPRLLVVSDNIPACLLSLRAQFHVWWCVLVNDKEVEKPKIIRWDWPAEVFLVFGFSKNQFLIVGKPATTAADSRPKLHLLNNLCSGQSWKESHPVIGESREKCNLVLPI